MNNARIDLWVEIFVVVILGAAPGDVWEGDVPWAPAVLPLMVLLRQEPFHGNLLEEFDQPRRKVH